MNGLKVIATREPFINDTISIRIADISNIGVVIVANPLMFRSLESDGGNIELPPAIRITPDDAQQFMDELWRVGIRPTEGAGSAGAMAATVRHLEDMRKLVFNDRKS